MKKMTVSFSAIILLSLLISACGSAGVGLPPSMEGSLLDFNNRPVSDRIDSEPESAKSEQPAEVGEDVLTDSALPAAQVGILAAYEETLVKIYEDVNPSVVNIQVKVGAMEANQGIPETPEFHSDPDNDLPKGPQFGYGMGSGFVWDQQGHIVTNNHVVDGAIEISVTMYDGTSASAELVGADPDSDLAVLKVDLPAEALRPIQVADSSMVRVGELAIAIGNPFGLDGTMTVGIVSALGRTLPASEGIGTGPAFSIPDVIQTDAPINPGNSGGVLVDDRGQLIGVTTAIESPVRANAGIGFAVPSDNVSRVVPVLIEDGVYQHSYLGISGTSLNPELAKAMGLDPAQRGALVSVVNPGGPAEKAGLRGSDRQAEMDGFEVPVGGDVIIAIDGYEIKEMDDLIAYLTANTSVGQTISLSVLRDGGPMDIPVTLAARPDQNQTASPTIQKPRAATAWLGITGMTLSPDVASAMDLLEEQAGVLVLQVEPASPASSAGLRGGPETFGQGDQQILIGGDVIVAFDGGTVDGFESLVALLADHQPGDEISLSILREGVELEILVTLGERS